MYKLILLFSVLAASSLSVANAGILGQYHSQNEVHDYSFGYYGGPSAKHESKVKSVTKGEYSYVDPNGKLQTVNYTSDEHGFRVNATNLPTKLGHAIAPVSGSPRSYPTYSTYYPAPPSVVLQPPVVYYPQPAPIVPHPIDHTYFVPETSDSHSRVRRGVYPSGPSPKSYAPEGYYEYSESYPAPAAYVPSVKSFLPSEPADYVDKPSSPAFTFARAHIPVQEVTHDIPEETPVPAVPGKQLFVPSVAKQLAPVTTPPPTTPPPTTAAPVTTPAPAYQPYYPENPSYYSPPRPSTPPPPPSPTPYATTPAPIPTPEIYIKPVVRHYAPIPANEYYEAPHYEHEAPVHAPPPPPAPTTTTLPPPTTTAAPAPTTRAPNPHRDEYYFVPHGPRPGPVVHAAPLPVVPVPVPVVPVAPVIATPVRSQFHSQDELGQYTYGYSNENSAKHEIKTADGITQGQYSYVDANGHVQSVHYVSDDHHGFRVAATNLPRAPVPVPVPGYKKK